MIKVRLEKLLNKDNWLDKAILVVNSHTHVIHYTGVPKTYEIKLRASSSCEKNEYTFNEDTLIRDALANGWYLVTKHNRVVTKNGDRYT